MLELIRLLLPRSKPWRIIVDKVLRRFFEGLAAFFQTARDFVDLVILDVWPNTTRQLTEHEDTFGLPHNGSEEVRRARITAQWRALGGQSPHYLQGILQDAGFDVWIHEWWEGPDVSPRTPRDPRLYVLEAFIGLMQDGADIAMDGDPDAMDSSFVINDQGYWANLDLSGNAQPPVPSDPSKWPFFLYFGGETFPEPALVPGDRLQELKELIQKIKPAHLWIVLLQHSVGVLVTEDGFSFIITEDGVSKIAA